MFTAQWYYLPKAIVLFEVFRQSSGESALKKIQYTHSFSRNRYKMDQKKKEVLTLQVIILATRMLRNRELMTTNYMQNTRFLQ